MIFIKNVPSVERVIRIATGIALLILGLWTFSGSIAGGILTATGAVALLTGFVGFCPMCAMVGRKLDQGK